MSQVPNKTKYIVGLGISILTGGALLISAIAKLTGQAILIQTWEHIGWTQVPISSIGVIEAISVVLYFFPQTSVLGAILLTGYLGGAIGAHVRIGEPFLSPLILGILVWGGLYLRNLKISSLIPWANHKFNEHSGDSRK